MKPAPKVTAEEILELTEELNRDYRPRFLPNRQCREAAEKLGVPPELLPWLAAELAHWEGH